MIATGVKRWVFQLEVRGRVVEPREALGHLVEALARIGTAQGGRPVWQVTQALTPVPGAPNQLQVRAATGYPGGGSVQLGAVAVKAQVAYHNFRGVATILTLNFADNLGWRVPYAQVPPIQAVRLPWDDVASAPKGYAELVFYATVDAVEKVLHAHYGAAAVVGMEQDA